MEVEKEWMGICFLFDLSAHLPQVNYRLQDRRESSVTNSQKEIKFWQGAQQQTEGIYAGEVVL